jgi:hypothetical protein
MVNKIISDAISSGKKIFLWGASSSGHRAYYRLLNLGAKSSNISFIDTNYKNIESSTGLEIQSPDVLKSLNLDSSIILISSTISKEIIESLDLQLNPITYYIHELIFERNQSYKYPKEFADLISKINLELNLDQEEAYNIWNIIINLNKTPGDLIEIGVYKGGSMMAMILANTDNTRKFWLYDTFEGMTSPCEHDYDLDNRSAKTLMDKSIEVKCIASLDEVKNNISSNTTVVSDNIKYIVGDITKTETFPTTIAVLRLDTDFYESTAFELANFYNLVSSGGYIIIDDYGHWKGARKATDQYFKGRKVLMHRVDYTCRLIVK